METYLRDLMVALQNQSVTANALVHQSTLSLRSSEETSTGSTAPMKITRASVWARVLFTPISPTFPFLLRKLIKKDRCEILHLHMPNVSAFWALLLPSARRLPWVIHWHSDVLSSEHSLGLRLFYRLYRPFESALLRRAARIIVTSQPYLESSIPLAAFKHKCTVVPLGIRPLIGDLEKEATQATTTQKTHDGSAIDSKTDMTPLQVLAVGRLTYYKGFDFLIRALAQTPNTLLTLVGTGEKGPELRQLAQDLKVYERINFYGGATEPELLALIQGCDCLCLPSIERTEAFGVVLLEAMSCGKACVVSNVPGSGMGWVVSDGCTGLHATPADVVSLAEQLKSLRDNEDMTKSYGAAGSERFNQLFCIDTSAAAVAATYRDIL
ncbi:glycosyl transferase, group 1 [gamma proteobacterium NOR5-3]|nr:glycosyl transferase, group 1 [gamma proteobacterium NOR5-3]